jgi:SAM-dependent methyltransferase
MTEPSRWASLGRGDGGQQYADRFDALAADGRAMHGEAAFCAELVPGGGRVLDAGCGTGRVAIRLAELGFGCVGVDADPSMLAAARRASATVEWQLLDLVDVASLHGSRFDLIVAAGNVIPLLAPGTEEAVIDGLASRLAPDGVLVTGFGLDPAHLPLAEAPFGLGEYDAWCEDAGLELVERFSTWDRETYVDGCGYAVSVHRRARP